jgi:hypothetical protein
MFLAALMPNGANGAKYNNLKSSMKENFAAGTSTYPKSPEAVLHILNAYQLPEGWGKRRQDASAGQGPKKELCLLKLKETTCGRQQ